MTRVVLVKGAEPALVAQAVHRAIEELAEGRDLAACVEELGQAEDLDLGRVVDALMTPPFLVDRRVVVVRDAGRLSAADVERIAPVLGDLPDGVACILAAGGGTLPASLSKAVSQGGEVRDASVGSSMKDRRAFVEGEVRRGPVTLDARAAEALVGHLGEDLARVEGVLETLAVAYGPGARLTEAELSPFLGSTGSVPEWDLTDAITDGDARKALAVLHRLCVAGGRAPQVVVSSLQRHYLRLLRLDGAGLRTKEDAAALLKVSAYPAGKLLVACRSLGAGRLRQAVAWIATADADVKGQTALEPMAVLEVLVGRLARLHRAAGRGAA